MRRFEALLQVRDGLQGRFLASGHGAVSLGLRCGVLLGSLSAFC